LVRQKKTGRPAFFFIDKTDLIVSIICEISPF
jgi:hypothetical protein